MNLNTTLTNTFKGDVFNEEYLATELDEQIHNVKFTPKISKASCKIKDIQGFVFGGFSSRFWMLRKHINSLDDKSLQNLPFYSWNCITLELEHRNIDLVIRNQT